MDIDRKNTAPSLRTIAMPADTNPNGDIFGGWILSQMDLAGGTYLFTFVALDHQGQPRAVKQG